MPLSSKLPPGLGEFDVIIAGGGTAACIVASRLAAASPDLSILVIEGGKNNFNDPNIITPALFLQNLVPSNKNAIFYRGKKSVALAGREPIIQSGGILGGGSSINFMMYTRAQRSDFDSWKTEGWSADNVIPFLKMLETYHGGGDSKTHGCDGPVHISDGGFQCPETLKDFISAAKKIGYPELEDLQDLDANNGFGAWFRNVSVDGKRQDTAHAYLHPLLQDGNHPNLHVLVESKVCRVLFDQDKKATTVEFTPNPDFNPVINIDAPDKATIKARKLVVVACGACGTPSVLERSGIGNPDVLKGASVPLIADLPGVGHDYQDHNLIFYSYRTNLDRERTLDGILSGRMDVQAAIEAKAPILGWNTVDIASKLRPTEEEVAALGTEFQEAWDRDFKNEPNRPLVLMAPISSFLGDHSLIAEGQYVCVANYTAYPYSRGSIHITGPKVEDAPIFDLGFFTDPHDIDLKKHVWAYKKQRELLRRTELYRGELEINHPKFPVGSKAACVGLTTEGHRNLDDVRDIEYTAEDDKAIEQYLRENVNTTWHSLGTAKMAPKDQMGVVDKNLNVYDVKCLKVVDMSIVPENVGANTCNTAMVIGEKGADIIMRELGLLN